MSQQAMSQQEFDAVTETVEKPKKAKWTEEQWAGVFLVAALIMIVVGHLWMLGTSSLQADYAFAYYVRGAGFAIVCVLALVGIAKVVGWLVSAGYLGQILMALAFVGSLVAGCGALLFPPYHVIAAVCYLTCAVLFVGSLTYAELVRIRQLLQAQHDRAEAHAAHQAPRP